MNQQKSKLKRRQRRRQHVRSKIVGTPQHPRLSVNRSSKHIYAQLIDDLAGETLASASSLTPDMRKQLPNGGNIKAAEVVGKALAEAAKAKGIGSAAFDRGHYKFHGRVRALAIAATANGLVCCALPGPEAEEKPKGEGKPAGKAEKPPKGEKPAKKVKGEAPKDA